MAKATYSWNVRVGEYVDQIEITPLRPWLKESGLIRPFARRLINTFIKEKDFLSIAVVGQYVIAEAPRTFIAPEIVAFSLNNQDAAFGVLKDVLNSNEYTAISSPRRN